MACRSPAAEYCATVGSAAVVMYSASWCSWCTRARNLLRDKGVAFTEIDVDQVPGSREEMRARSGRTSVPQIFIGEHHVGGFDDARALDLRGELDPLLAAAC
jgi:glutaredoxin 3